MAISPEALDRFLNRVLADRPKFKGADPDELLQRIYGCTGAYYQERTQSRPHQLEGVTFALYMRQALLLYHMRLGKSKMALDWAAQLKRARLTKKKGLILAHAPIGAQVWQNQVATHSDLSAILVQSGPGAADAFVDACLSRFDLIIISQSTMQALFATKKLNRKQQPKLYPDYEKLRLAATFFDHAVIDETHFYANPWGLPFMLASGLVEECDFRLGLTGTPIGRDPFKLWAQAYLIDSGKHFSTQYKFFEIAFGRQEHYSRDGFTMKFNKRMMPVFQYKLDALALSYAKDEIKTADIYQGIVELSMGPEQRKAYNDTVDGLLKLRLDDTIELENTFTKLRMIASGFVPFTTERGEKKVMHFDSVKLAYLREFAAELPSDTQCLIFHEFIYSGELICKVLTECKITHAWLHGDTPNKAEELAKFETGAAQILVANTATGGTSINLPQADYLCFFESPCSPITRAQAQARPMARGDRPLIVDDLICAPIEDKILGFINEGNDMLKVLLRGNRKSLHQMLRAK